jgi:hypothetical protein
MDSSRNVFCPGFADSLLHYPELAWFLATPFTLGAPGASQVEGPLAQPFLYNMRFAMGRIHDDNSGFSAASPLFHLSMRSLCQEYDHYPA